MKVLLSGTALAVVMSLMPAVANAQTQGDAKAPPATDAATSNAGADIIVTAGRVARRLQDTALTVNVLSADALKASGVTDTTQLQVQVPNLQYQSAAGTSFVYLRGIGSAVFGVFGGNSVATYVDGVYVPQQTGAAQNLFDIDRVEVLRGPQATLYGRNATGGAILISSAKPQHEFGASGDVQYGNYNALRLRAVVNAPLGSGIALRVSGVHSRHDGYSTNLTDGSKFDSSDYWGVRASLRAQPSARLDLTLTGTYTNESGSPGQTKATQPATLPFLPAPQGKGQAFSSDPRASYHDIQEETPGRQWGVTLNAKWDAGFADVAATSGFARYEQGPIYLDLDDSNAALLEYRGVTSGTNFYYQDLLFSSRPDSGRFEWLLGGTVSRENTFQRARVLNPGGLPAFTLTTSDVDAYAAYAQLSYAVTSALKLVGGLRYSSETRHGESRLETVATPTTKTDSWRNLSPRIALEYRPAKHTLLYLSATSGFKSGTFDPQNVTNAASPEHIWSYEAGLKTELLDRRLTLNVTAFHYDYRDLQVFQGVLSNGRIVTFLQNAGSAKVDGVEFEPSFAVTRNLRVGGNLAWLNARYDSGIVLVDAANSPSAASVVKADVGGNPLPQAAHFTGTAFLDVTLPLRDGSHLDFHTDYYRQSGRYFTSFKDPTLYAPSFDVVNARLSYTLPGGKAYVAAFGRNLGNTLVYYGIGRVPPFGNNDHYAAPRTYGVEAGFKF